MDILAAMITLFLFPSAGVPDEYLAVFFETHLVQRSISYLILRAKSYRLPVLARGLVAESDNSQEILNSRVVIVLPLFCMIYYQRSGRRRLDAPDDALD